MAHCPDNRSADLLGKDLGSNNGWGVNLSVSKICGISKEKRRAPRVGLLGGRRKRHSTIDRFWARVQKSPDGCWPFAGAACNVAGHRHISHEDGSRSLAHRYSYALHFGPIPSGSVVRHKCDNAACVNPAHLLTGSQRDNVHDSISRNRRNAFGRQRLIESDIPGIRARYAAGESTKGIAASLGVSNGCIFAVVNRLTWGHVAGELGGVRSGHTETLQAHQQNRNCNSLDGVSR